MSISVLFLYQFPDYLSRFFFFNDTATTEIYTLSLHDALPILRRRVDRARASPPPRLRRPGGRGAGRPARGWTLLPDRKSTRLNSSHANISYAVFCLKKKKQKDEKHKHTKYVICNDRIETDSAH